MLDQLPNESPRPKMPVGMSFPDALKEVINGKKITKMEWMNKDIYGILANGILMLHKEDGFHQWVLSEGDLNGRDWVVLDQGQLNID
jgi:hypothetical protein